MVTIGIDPTWFWLGSFAVSWYMALLFVAVASVVVVSVAEGKRVGIRQRTIYSLALWGILGGLVGSRLLIILDLWEFYRAHPEQIWALEGHTIYGAVLGALAATLIFARIKRLSFWKLGDIVAPGAVLGKAIGRIGCLLHGCCYGLPTELPWAVVYTHPDSVAPLQTPMHPAVAYQLVWNLLVFGALWRLRKLQPKGSLFLLYLTLYAVGDLGTRFFRVGAPFLLGLYQAQLVGLAVLAVAAPLLIQRRRRLGLSGPS